MADAVMEPRPPIRYFCHRCSIEFEDLLQEYTCPYCAGGFIEQVDGSHVLVLSGDNFRDAAMSNIDDMSNLDDSDDTDHRAPPVLNDLAFLMSGGRLRNRNGGNGGGATAQPAGAAPRRNTLMEELVWMIGGARPGTGAVTAGAPFVFVGAPGDYVFGGEGLDAVVTQLLGQLENAGPPPMPSDRLAALLDEPVNEEQAAANTACSVCWDNFVLGDTVCRLECDHIFHSACIRPWLQLHATCPICRRSLLPDPPAAATTSATATATTTTTNTTNSTAGDTPAAAIRTSIAAAIPRILLRRIVHHPGYRAGADGRQPGSSAATRPTLHSRSAVWTPHTDPTTNSTVWTARPVSGSNSTSSASPASAASAASVISDIERNYNMDLDMD